ncbi:hypothetical protein [Streptomyces albidoflavus]|uniref:hypothetical protein n=1 Tax=Streptomyces albidoflavus TaxID=1886 RepID=UPI00342F657A
MTRSKSSETGCGEQKSAAQKQQDTASKGAALLRDNRLILTIAASTVVIVAAIIGTSGTSKEEREAYDMCVNKKELHNAFNQDNGMDPLYTDGEIRDECRADHLG